MRFILNVVLDEEKRPVAIYGGEPEATFERLVTIARKPYTVPVPHKYDVVVGGAGSPKEANLYQASRAPSYIFFAPTPVVEKGGVLVSPVLKGPLSWQRSWRYIQLLSLARNSRRS